MRKRAEGESAVFAKFHVGGGCVSLTYRFRDNRNKSDNYLCVLRSVAVMVGDVGVVIMVIVVVVPVAFNGGGGT